MAEEVSKPPSLPPYTEMIFAAVDAEKEGSSKSSISKFIESTYGDMPAGHTNLLSENLNKMKENGDLVLVKNNYMRPDPNAPAKRGRGRPPKAKDASAPQLPALATGEPGDVPVRGRGRPKKDPNAPPAAKKAKPDSGSPAEPTPSKSGRPRGRPRKTQPEVSQNGVEAN
jgi:hypothetical protein